MQQTIAIISGLALWLAIPGVSGAVTIDFEALEHVDSLTVDHGHSYTEDGFTITSPDSEPFGLSTFGTLESRYPGSTALFNDTVGGITTTMTSDAMAFNLFSIQLAEFCRC